MIKVKDKEYMIMRCIRVKDSKDKNVVIEDVIEKRERRGKKNNMTKRERKRNEL